jgi:hypothetical protein
MAGSKDRMAAAAGDPGRLRASHADREQVIDVLKTAFVAGRLTKDEFDTRAAQAFASRTYAELAPLTADLPAAQPARKPARDKAQPPGPIALVMTTTLLTAGLWATMLSAQPDNGVLGMLLFSFTFAWLGSLLLGGAVMLERRQHSRRP